VPVVCVETDRDAAGCDRSEHSHQDASTTSNVAAADFSR